jgi:uncharacterized protein (DUF3820 family)
MKKDHKARLHTRFPFGKYKGYYFKDVPLEYFEWAARNFVEPRNRPLLTMIVEEIEYRHFNNNKSKRSLSESEM